MKKLRKEYAENVLSLQLYMDLINNCNLEILIQVFQFLVRISKVKLNKVFKKREEYVILSKRK